MTDTTDAASATAPASATDPAAGPGERHEFSAEVGRLLDLVVHALYSEREIFLRELVANAADALDRRRFDALTEPALALPTDAKIRIVPDKPGRALSIIDDGIGMTRDEMISHLGTIARSGTRAISAEIAAARPEERPSLIGQFGVGFYSAFMVAEKVEVVSRRAGTDAAWRWSSAGQGDFVLSPDERASPGTEVILHLKSDAEEFLDPVRLEAIVRKWADHITWPVTIARDGKDLPANEGTALWRKPKAEISEASYVEFYRHLGHLFDKPWATLHWRAEGALEFYALLFIPQSKPFAVVEEERRSKLRLHVRRMFITDEADLLPSWLRFVQGVVDTEDLPLNVSREMLQSTPVLARIRKALTNRVLTELKSRAKEADDYLGFWENFGAILKEGLWEDSGQQKDIMPLLRFRSSAVDGWTDLDAYVQRMKPAQEAIYLLAGEQVEALRDSPVLEGFRARGVEVLLLDDPIDAFWPDRVGDFAGKPIRRAGEAIADLEKLPLEAGERAPAMDVTALAKALKEALGEAVSEVRASERLVESAAALTSGAAGGDLFRERLMRRAGRAFPSPPPALEINPRHALIQALAARVGDADFADLATLLLDLARIQEGEAPRNPAAFSRRVGQLLAASLPVRA
uniref:Chaperone protein HtpG n=1 Tax=Acidicaldus sp. TaxID=1872105 RepID=A0A8J4M6A6_9PROT